MRAYRLEVEDSMLDKVMMFLQNLPKGEVRIKEDKKKIKPLNFNSIALNTKDYKFNREEANAR